MVRKKLSEDNIEDIGGFNELIDVRDMYEDDGEFFVSVKVENKHTNPLGIVHGGLIFSLCDTVVGGFCLYNDKPSVTLDSNIFFYKSAKAGDTLIAKLVPRKEGRNVSVYMVEVTNQKDEKIADATLTMMQVHYK